MRVTMPMMTNTFLRNLAAARERMEASQGQITSGRRFDQPADDPIGAARAMSFRTALETMDQHLRNIDEASAWLGATESALGSATDILQRARELIVQASNDTLSSTDRAAVRLELEQLREQLMGAANTTYGGRYVFGGQLTETQPYTMVLGTPTYNGDSNAIVREIGVNTTISVNVPGATAFGPALTAIGATIATLAGGGLPGAELVAVDDALDSLLTARAQVGAKLNRLADQRQRLETVKTDTLAVKSKIEDVDLAEAVSDYSVQETVFKAALQMGARAVQPSLLDYLR